MHHAPSANRPTVLISGVTVVRNAILLGYPVVEAITSILPIVDEFIVAVGAGDDGTRDLIASIGDPKIRIVDTVWDLSKTVGGRELATQTNAALTHCRGTWCFYLQADELVHERDLPIIRERCEQLAGEPRVEALLFAYTHFYGSFSVIATGHSWYRNEVRIVRNGIGARSIGDAQSFMVGDHKPRVVRSGATILHYGWAKRPESMGRKLEGFHYWYTGGKPRTDAAPAFAFRQQFALKRFTGTHPATIQPLVARQDWMFEPVFRPTDWNRKDWKNWLSRGAELLTGRRWGERKKYKLIRL
ncbi:MAG: hypothetical protein U5K74_11640 [Gemmatimonadaceae bacterium]|nr:hypothetical protein [Gemmatimonadaceae bacterium]